MKRSLVNSIGGPVVLTLALLGASGVLLWFSHNSRDKAVAARTLAAQQMHEQDDRYRHTTQDEMLIRQTIKRFDMLHERGIIGTERRLDWADHLRAFREEHRIAQLDFELAPQHTVGPLSSPADYQLSSSRMQVRAGLLHEGDFFDFIADLRKPGNAIVAPRHCTLTPVSDTASTQSINLRAECTLEWMTVTQAGAPKK